MKVLMENKKKQLIYSGVIILSAGVMVWMWWGSGLLSGGSNSGESPLTAVSASVLSSNNNTVLPYGKTFNIEVFSDSRFKALVVPTKLDVNREELGRENPFLPL